MPGPPTIAVLDACVLYPAALRDTLLRAVEAGLYRRRWREDILAEVRRSLIATRRQTEAQADDLIAEMRRGFPDASIEGYEVLIGAMENHPKDRHVLAAAVRAGADLIVTSNLRHFPAEALAPFSVSARSPDEFLSDLFRQRPDVILNLLRKQAADLRSPPLTVANVMIQLSREAPTFVAAVGAELF